MKTSNKILIVVAVVIVIAIAAYFAIAHSRSVTPAVKDAPDSPSRSLMAGILFDLKANNIRLAADTLTWNTGKTESPGGAMIKETYPAASFMVKYTPADNEVRKHTWDTTGKVDDIDIVARFENELKAKGFMVDWNNSGDATLSGSTGYTKGNEARLIKYSGVEMPQKSPSDAPQYTTNITITCADRTATTTSGITPAAQ